MLTVAGQYKKRAIEEVVEVQTFLKEKYENLQAADRTLDKQAKKEFMDYPNGDTLYKAFRKKYKIQRQRHSIPVDPTCPNPYGERTIRKQEYSLVEDLPPPLDNIGVMVWNRVCELREKKLQIERNIKEKALELAEITAHVQQLREELNKSEEQIQQINRELERAKDLQHKLCTDVKVQFIVKQGQIEAESSEFVPDYSRMLLVHRSAVESPISKIRVQS
ncbi:cilia- and flagella-associated protein 43-like [Limulus polyphemus]|uniref:Cilia- and flagella-associated protein 43-like n=1 Tax=Limulus polyphemus TaxID=6850 RepID=A0ABM1TS44_LIMPO|nr:cilia- and flagella-associated protein 43-like [Limulus polyphemus]